MFEKRIAFRIKDNGKPTEDPMHAIAVERGRAAVQRLMEMGIIDSEGRLLREGLPSDPADVDDLLD